MNKIKKIIQFFLPIAIIKYCKTLKSRWKFRGKQCRIDSAYVSTNASLEDHIVIAENCVIEETVCIGRYTYMQSGTNINNAEIGRFCSIGNNVVIAPWRHPIEMISTSPKVYREILGGRHYCDLPKRTYIGNDVWIGTGAIIMDGVKIGNGAVIGAGSIVTKNVPPYAIVVGNPSHIIKYRFDESTIKKLEKICWFNLNDAELKMKTELLCSRVFL